MSSKGFTIEYYVERYSYSKIVDQMIRDTVHKMGTEKNIANLNLLQVYLKQYTALQNILLYANFYITCPNGDKELKDSYIVDISKHYQEFMHYVAAQPDTIRHLFVAHGDYKDCLQEFKKCINRFAFIHYPISTRPAKPLKNQDLSPKLVSFLGLDK